MSGVNNPVDGVSTGLFGKLPTRGDFVRVNVTGGALAFANHLEQAVDVCRRTGRELPAEGAAFLHHGLDAETGLVGFMRPSVDKVGRSFPICVFVELDAGVLAANFDLVPAIFAGFLDDAARLAAEARTLDAPALEQRVAALPVPGDDVFAAAPERIDGMFAQTTVTGFFEPLVGPVQSGAQFFAAHTLAAACEQARTQDPSTPGVTLLLPRAREDDAVLWLALVRRLMGESVRAPTLLWTRSAAAGSPTSPGQLLVSFGAPPPSSLAFLAGGLSKSPKLWPVACTDAKALELARGALGAPQVAALSTPTATLEGVARAFGG